MREVVDFFVIHVRTFGRWQRIAGLSREEWLSVDEGSVEHSHELSKYASDWPDVDCAVVFPLEQNQLWSAIPSGGHVGSEIALVCNVLCLLLMILLLLRLHLRLLGLLLLLHDHCTSQPEIAQLHLRQVLIHQDVLGFQVPMQNLRLLTVVERDQNLEDYVLDIGHG